jgi:hypothetical protein
MRLRNAVAACWLVAAVSACGGGGDGTGNGDTMPPPSTNVLDMSASVTLTMEQAAQPEQIFLYSFPLPAGQQSLLGLQGDLSMVSSMPVFNQSLMTLATVPGACPPSGMVYPSYDALYAAVPNLLPLQGFILKNPNQGTADIVVDIPLPAGLPISNCMVLLMDWAGRSAVSMNSTLSLTYAAASSPSTAVLLQTNQEFVFGVDQGSGSTTDDSLSFVQETPLTRAGTILAFLGDISDSPFANDGTPPPPPGPWLTTNDIYLVPGGCPNQIPVNSSGYTDQAGNYYADIPTTAQHLLSVPLRGIQNMAATQTVYKKVSVAVQAGDCLLTVFGLNAPDGGGIDSETQVKALFLPTG